MYRSIKYFLMLLCLCLVACNRNNDAKEFRKAIKNNDIKKIGFMIEKNPELISKPIMGTRYNPIQIAAAKNNIQLGNLLVRKGVDVASLEYRSDTPMFIALRNGNTEFIHFLLKNGLEENIFTACALGEVEKVKKYINANSSYVNSGSSSLNVLGVSTIFNKYDCAKLLLKNGADVNEFVFYSPAYLAAEKNRLDFLKLFIKNGLDLSKEGKNLLEIAKASKSKDIIFFLLEKGIKSQESSSSLNTLKSIDKQGKIETENGTAPF